MTTLKDVLRDFMTEVRENEHLEYEDQKDPDDILAVYMEVIKRRVIGE